MIRHSPPRAKTPCHHGERAPARPAPTADLLAFGFHEHVVPPERSSDLSNPDDTQSPTLFHHCELSVSVGELLTAVELPAPRLITIDATECQSAAPRQWPFVPLTPPRS